MFYICDVNFLCLYAHRVSNIYNYKFLDKFRNDVETEEVLDDEEGNDVYADAEDNGAINKALNQDGLQSPDSGIHGDKSNIDLNVTA